MVLVFLALLVVILALMVQSVLEFLLLSVATLVPMDQRAAVVLVLVLVALAVMVQVKVVVVSVLALGALDFLAQLAEILVHMAQRATAMVEILVHLEVCRVDSAVSAVSAAQLI